MDYLQSPFDGSQLCQAYPVDIFFPDKEEDSPSEYIRKVVAAKEVCFECPIRKSCLKYALEHTSLSGVWGGTTTAQRAKMRSQRNMGVLPAWT